MNMSLEAADLDRGERKILAALQANARLNTQELAELSGLSTSAAWRRVKSLEERGYIQGYVARLDAKRLGYGVSVYAQITLERHDRESIKAFEALVLGLPQVLECTAMVGGSDYLLQVVAHDHADYERFLSDHLISSNFVSQVNSMFTLRHVKTGRELPLNLLDAETAIELS